MTRVIATADLHGELPEIPPCDILVLAGDLLPDHPIGKAERYSLPNVGSEFQLEYLDGPFREWLRSVPANHIVAIAGNHDFVFERMAMSVRELMLPWIFLEDSEVTVEGLRIYGTPWVPGLPKWAFYATELGLQARAESIPRGLDILISHGPPFGIRDLTCPRFGSKHAGDQSLKNELSRIKPKAVVCGHIHEGYGQVTLPYTKIYNVALNNEWYCPDNKPVLLTEFLDRDERKR